MVEVEVGPDGQTSHGTINNELRDLMAFYREAADELGELNIWDQTAP